MSATEKQIEFLERLNLPVPPSFIAASRLLDFAQQGNDSSSENAKQRRATIRKYSDRWTGKLVQVIQRKHQFKGAYGHVEYLQARTRDEIEQIIASHSARNPFPFVAVVRLDPTNANVFVEVHLTGLKHVDEVQGRLFPPQVRASL